MLKKSEIAIASELKKFLKKDNVFIKKASFSIFRGNKFKKFVKNNNISKLFICGLDTHACVYMTTMEAFERGFEVKVIEDLCAAHHGKEYHQNALEFLKRNLGRNITVNSESIQL